MQINDIDDKDMSTYCTPFIRWSIATTIPSTTVHQC